MRGFLEAVFWICAGLLFVHYVGYPVLLAVLPARRRRCKEPGPGEWPVVSVLIAARNEEKVIGARLDNIRSQDYPGTIEILVGSDASTDATDAIVAARASEGVTLVRSETRAGKPRIIQMLASLARGQVFVFTDADTVFGPDTVRELVVPLADPAVGCVDGSRRNSLSTETCESVYWKYEKWIKGLCSRLGAVLGATGAVFSLRREAFIPLSEDRADDFELAVMARIAGYDCVFAPEAVAMEPAPDDRAQYRRLVRIVSWMSTSCMKLALRAVSAGRPLIALQLLVHKVLRWKTGFMIIAATASAGLLWHPWPYAASFSLLMIFHAAAAAGAASHGSLPSKLLFPYYFWLMNSASMAGLLRSLAGRPVETWERKRAAGSP